VNPAASKKSVMHHAVPEQKKDDHQNNYKQELSWPERRRLLFFGVRRIQWTGHLILTTSANSSAIRHAKLARHGDYFQLECRYSTASPHSTVRRSRLLLCASITARIVRKACSGVTSSAAFFSIASRTFA
jgi:hypothetical protein